MVPPHTGFILLIEDNLGDRMLFGEALEHAQAGMTLRTAQTADEGLAVIAAAAADPAGIQPLLVVLDLHMPGKDGKAVLAEMKRMPGAAAVPVMILTSSNRPRDMEDCLKLGACGFRVKPNDWSGYQELIGFLRPVWEKTGALG